MSKLSTTKKSTAKSKSIGTRSSVFRSAASGEFLEASGAAVHAKSGRVLKTTTKRNLRGEQKPAINSDEWSQFDQLSDKQIEKAVSKDRDAAPVDDDVWKNARVIMPVAKQPISIRLDEDVVEYFKKSGPGYQSRMNAVLRSYMTAKK